MNPVTVALVELITLHMIDGRVVQVNPQLITQLISRNVGGAPNEAVHDDVQCVVRFVDGSFASVAEDCKVVRELMEGEEKP